MVVEKNIAPATQNQAMNALVFLYKKVLRVQLNDVIDAVRATKKNTIPVVMTREEVRQIVIVIGSASAYCQDCPDSGPPQ